MVFMLNKKAQGSIEYLLLIGGAVIIAAIVIVVLTGMGGTGINQSHVAGNKIEGGYGGLQNIINCEPTGTTETICNDGIDNDCQGGTDCADTTDCPPTAPPCNCTPAPETLCSDGIDNDCDTFTDCVDPDCSTTPACWYLDWDHRQAITMQGSKIQGTLANFPVAVVISGSNEVFNAAKNLGANSIVFADSDKKTKLDHEIVTYSAAGNFLEAHVKIPSLSAGSDKIIYMYYDPSQTVAQNPTAVWTNGYAAVYHMNNATPTTIADSTSNNLTGAKVGATEVDIGPRGKAQNFVRASSQYINLGNSNILKPLATGFTVEAWANFTGTAVDYSGIFTNKTSFEPGFSLEMGTAYSSPAGQQIFAWFYNNVTGFSYRLRTTFDFSSGTWYYIVATRDVPDGSNNANAHFYIPQAGYSVATATARPHTHGTGNTLIGAFYNTPNYYFNGMINELRVSDIARSPEWINTQYNNQSSPSTFMVFGAEENK